jgi:hypothetical protein
MGCWAEVYYFFVAGEDEAFAEIEGPDEDDNVFFASTCLSGCEGILVRESKSPAGRVIVGRTGGLIVCRNEREILRETEIDSFSSKRMKTWVFECFRHRFLFSCLSHPSQVQAKEK